MSSEALELALALYRVPSQRFVLRDRALPPDIGSVIRLASGKPELLRPAAELLCEPEPVVLEAVRFYLQQVLFYPDADAYRVLGLEPNAPYERVREHYRWLQRWLHPDRRGEDWDALYATRVNGAWHHLRNDAARHSYDLAHATARPHANAVHHPIGGFWTPIPNARPQRHWVRRAVLGASLLSCALLLLVVFLRDDPAPIKWDSASHSALTPSEHSAATTNGEQPDQQTPNRERVTTTSASLTAPSTPLQKPTVNRAAQRKPRTLASPQATALVETPKLIAASAAAPTPQPVPMTKPAANLVTHGEPLTLARPQAAALTKAPKLAAASAAPSRSTPPPTARMPARPSMPVPVSVPISAKTAFSLSSHNHAPVPNRRIAAPRLAPAEMARRANVATLAAATVRPIPATSANLSTHAVITPKRTVASTTAPAAAGGVSRPTTSTASPSPPPARAQVPKIVAATPAVTAPAVTTSRSAGSAAPAAKAAVPVAETLARVDLARTRVRQVVAYFNSTNPTPPAIWLDTAGQVSTERLHGALYARNQLQNPDSFALEAPSWYLSDERARLSATYHVQHNRTRFESGRFSVEMIWSGQTWRVTQVTLEPAR